MFRKYERKCFVNPSNCMWQLKDSEEIAVSGILCGDCPEIHHHHQDTVSFELAKATPARSETSLFNLQQFDGSFEFIGQANNQFILVKIKDMIMAVDQHAAHERIRFELLLSVYRNDSTAITQTVLPQDESLIQMQKNRDLRITQLKRPIVIRVKRMVFEYCQRSLAFWGFLGDCLDQERIQITALPTVILNTQYYLQVSEIITSFYLKLKDMAAAENEDSSYIPDELMEAIKSSSCKGALRFNSKISNESAMKLVTTLLTKCQDPFHCAHGRPSLVPLARLDRL